MIHYLLVRSRGNRYKLYSPDTYGADTWGFNSQLSLEKKRKYWYIRYWRGGSFDLDIPDYKEDIRLNVVMETSSYEDIVEYMRKAKAPTSEFKRVYREMRCIIRDNKALSKIGGDRT